MLEVSNIKKIYRSVFGGNEVEALRDVNFSVERGEMVAIMGESGSGKTTLLNLLAAIDKPTSGKIILDGMDFSAVKESQAAEFRRDNLGFVFQEFNLLDNFSVRDNILLPLVLLKKDLEEMDKKVNSISKSLGIFELLEKYPYEISGGQKQRAAVARALINDPKILLADEPTGALDSKSSDELLMLFTEIHKSGQTILLVTHSINAASKAGRVLFIKDGVVIHQLYRENKNHQEFYQSISDELSRLSKGSSI